MRHTAYTPRRAARRGSTFPLQVRIDRDLRRRLRAKSASTGLTIRWLVEQALEEYLDALDEEARR